MEKLTVRRKKINDEGQSRCRLRLRLRIRILKGNSIERKKIYKWAQYGGNVAKTKIEWVKNPITGEQGYTINPIVGCKNSCPYCYAKRMNDRFHFVKKWDEPEHQEGWSNKLDKIKKPSIIFMGSMTDLFGEWVPSGEIYNILFDCGHFPEHRFLFLTKNPKRYNEFKGKFPFNCWRGATISNNTGGIPLDIDFVSVEPLTDPKQLLQAELTDAKWIIVGGMTPKSCHENYWLEPTIFNCKKGKRALFLKGNLHYPKVIQQFPKELKGGGR